MQEPKLRAGARAIILDEADRVLLCRFAFDRPEGSVVVWATPGGGVDPGESLLEALRRELVEEVGLRLAGEQPPHVWHQRVVQAGHTTGYDGVTNDYFLVRTNAFVPRGTMSDAELAAESVTEFRWWTREELDSYQGPELFSPRALPMLLTELLSTGLPASPIRLGA